LPTRRLPDTDLHDAHLDYVRIADYAGVITRRLEGAPCLLLDENSRQFGE
jgi:hypothetical protein